VNLVSIPHRYDKNGNIIGCKNLARIVSIPHRYDKNCQKWGLKAKISKVSIPHRYDKNGRCDLLPLGIIGFQFLIGTIKTTKYLLDLKKRYPFQFLIGTIKTR